MRRARRGISNKEAANTIRSETAPPPWTGKRMAGDHRSRNRPHTAPLRTPRYSDLPSSFFDLREIRMVIERANERLATAARIVIVTSVRALAFDQSAQPCVSITCASSAGCWCGSCTLLSGDHHTGSAASGPGRSAELNNAPRESIGERDASAAGKHSWGGAPLSPARALARCGAPRAAQCGRRPRNRIAGLFGGSCRLISTHPRSFFVCLGNAGVCEIRKPLMMN